MNIRTLALTSNLVLLIITFTSLLWSIDSELLWLGLVLGAVLSLPSISNLIAPNTVSDSLLIKINMYIMFMIALISLQQLYSELTTSSGQPVVGLIVTLFFGLALCANIQLLMIYSKIEKKTQDANDYLHTAYGGPSILLMLTIAIVITGMFQSLVFALSDSLEFFAVLAEKFIQRGVIPFMCFILFFWGVLLLVGNYLLVRQELKQVYIDLDNTFDNSSSASCLALGLLFTHTRPGNSRDKKLNCVDSLTNLIWNKVEYLYSLPRYINWAIPILGFIGTVLGISLAAESIGGLISSPDTNFSSALGDAIAPLGIAFDTTLVALSISVLLMLLQTLSQRWQERSLQAMEQKIREFI